MYKIIGKSLLLALLSTIASLVISFTFVPMMGGQVAGAGLVMTILCPIAISIPVSLIHFYQADRLRLANVALAQARDALENACARLQYQSRRDPLTNLLNRAAFMTDLSEYSSSGQHGGLLFLDVDHFKSVNDRFGHAAGDEALALIASVLSDLAAENDLVSRLGGEEFAIFLHGASTERMLDHSQAVREAIIAIDFRTATGIAVPLAISIGAFHCAPRFDPLEALAAADRNLYRAKSAGRNTVVA